MRPSRIAILVALSCLVLLSGCAEHQKEPPVTLEQHLAATSGAHDYTLLTGASRLITETDVQIVSVSGAAAAASADRAVQEDCLRWRINWINRLDLVRPVAEPHLRFVAIWTFITQLRISLTTGVDQHRFGALQPMFVKAVTALDAQALKLANECFPAKTVALAIPEITRLATSPTTTEVAGPEWTTAATDTINNILYIPLAPVSGLRGVGDAPAAINRFTDEAHAFGLIVEALPERTRWQMELFFLESQNSGAIAAALRDADRALAEIAALRQEFSTLTATAQKLPDRVEGMLQEVLKRQPELSRDLERLETTMTLTKQTVDSADRTVTNITASLGSARLALADVEKSAGAIHSAAAEIRALLADFKATGAASQPAPEKGGESFNPAGIQSMAAEVQSATIELRKLLGDLHNPADLSALDRSVQRLQSLIAQVTWSLAGLIVLFFASLLVYRRATRKAPKPD